MQQAIEENFNNEILDHYIIYRSYYQIEKNISYKQKIVDSKSTYSNLKNYIFSHNISIKKKLSIIINHFLRKKNNSINPKAMLLTESKEIAYKYYQCFIEYIKDNYP